MAAAAWPPHLCLAEAVADYESDAGCDTLSCRSGQPVLVQGDRTDAADGWVWALVDGSNGLLPSSYLTLRKYGGIHVRSLYEFEASDSTELSFDLDDELLLLPGDTDPTGWCTASHKVSRERGLVPQAYVAPAARVIESSPVAPGVTRPTPDVSEPVEQSDAERRSEALRRHLSSPARSDSKPASPSEQSDAERRSEALHRHLSMPARSGSKPVSPSTDSPHSLSADPRGDFGRSVPEPASADAQRRLNALHRHLATPSRSPARPAAVSLPSPPSSYGRQPLPSPHFELRAPPTRSGSALQHSAERDAEALQHSAERDVEAIGGGSGRDGVSGEESSDEESSDEEDGERGGEGAEQHEAQRPAAPVMPEEEAAHYIAIHWASQSPKAAGRTEAAGGAPRPPIGFEPAQAMDEIFHLGCLIAKGSEGDADHQASARVWRGRIGHLNASLRTWSEWEEVRPQREREAASVLQASVRRKAGYRTFQNAVREARMRRRLAEQAATSIQNSTRKAQAQHLVMRRRAAIRIQKHWRGVRGRRAAQRARALRAPLATPRQPLTPRRLSVPKLTRALSFTLGRRSSKRDSAAAPAASASNAAAPGASPRAASPDPLLDLMVDLTPREYLAQQPSPRRGLLRRSLSFDAKRSRPAPTAAPGPDADWQAQLDGQHAVAPEAARLPQTIRRSFSFGRAISAGRSNSFSRGLRTPRGDKPTNQSRKSTPGSGAPKTGAINLGAHRTASLFDDADDTR